MSDNRSRVEYFMWVLTQPDEFRDRDVVRIWMCMKYESKDEIRESARLIQQYRPDLYRKMKERWDIAFKE